MNQESVPGMTSLQTTSPYCPYVPLQTRHTEVVTRLMEQQTPFYVRMQLSPLEAQAACLLNAMVNGARRTPVDYFSFFCSSTTEAISGALKIVRHNHVVYKAQQPHIMAVFDPTGTLKLTFDPAERGLDEALVPGLVYIQEFGEFREYVKRQSPSSLLLRHATEISTRAIDELLQFSAERGIYTVLDESSTLLAKAVPLSALLVTAPDVIVLGENLSDCRMPAGCFMMSDAIYQVWNNAKTYNAHSNTWGGNSTSMTCVLEFLESTVAYKALPSKTIEAVKVAASSHVASSKLYAQTCSPMMAKMLNLGRLNKDIQSAHEATIHIQSRGQQRQVIDAAGTYGLNLRGHTPDDVADDVVATHDPNHDYWADLEALLCEKTGLPRLLPATSGATATENMFALALLAAAPRKKIIALGGGFSGKTLPSLIGTAKKRFRDLFRPVYPHIVTVDPFDGKFEQTLRTELEGDDVALVIVETIQGDGGVRACPQAFFDFLNANKERYGYLIGVDEVQTGIYKTGRFLNYETRIDQPDLVAMAKAMSENVFPVAGTLVSEDVFERARARNSEAVELYANAHRCQFGAQVAKHAIETGQRLGLADHAREQGEYFRGRLRELAKRYSVVKDIRGEGLMIGMEFDGTRVSGLIRANYGGLFASRCLNDPIQPVLVAVNPDNPLLIRFIPPLCITKAEIDAVVETCQRSLQCGVVSLLAPVVANLVRTKLRGA